MSRLPDRSSQPYLVLDQALAVLTDQGVAPRCQQDRETRGYWTSDDMLERVQAARWCAGCAVLEQCRAAGQQEAHAVWGGLDRTNSRLAKVAG